MKRAERQGLLILLLALGLLVGSGLFVYGVWREPNLAVAAGMLCAVGGVGFWALDALTLRLAPGRIIRKRIDNAICGKWSSCLVGYHGTGRLLEEYRKEVEDEAEDEDGIVPCGAAIIKREGLHELTLSVKWAEVQLLGLREGAEVLLILSGLTQGVFLVGELSRLERSQETGSVYVTLKKGLICDRQREVVL